MSTLEELEAQIAELKYSRNCLLDVIDNLKELVSTVIASPLITELREEINRKTLIIEHQKQIIENLEDDYSRDEKSYERDISSLKSKTCQLMRLQEKEARKNVEKIKKVLKSDTRGNIPKSIRKLVEHFISRSPMITDKDLFNFVIIHLYFIRDVDELIALRILFIQIELDMPSKLVEILSNPILYIVSNLNSSERVVLSELVTKSESDSEFVANIYQYINSINSIKHNATDEDIDSHKNFIANLLKCCFHLNIETSKLEEHICSINPAAWRKYMEWLQKDKKIAIQQSREELREAIRNMKAWIKAKKHADKELAEQIRIDAENERIADY